MSTAEESDMQRAFAKDIIDITNRLGPHVSHICDYHDTITVKTDEGVIVEDFYVTVLKQFRLTAHGLVPNQNNKPIGFEELRLMVIQDLVMIRRALVELENSCKNTFKHAV